jgi:hypothetical protein
MTKTSKKTAGRKSAAAKSPIKLSTPANVSRIIALLSDGSTGEAHDRIEEWADEITNGFAALGLWLGNGAAEVKGYRPRLARALRLIEATPKRSRNVNVLFARRAYDWIAEAVARTSAGGSLTDYVAEWEARKAESETDKRTLPQLIKRGEEMIRDYDNFDADTRALIDLSLQNIRDTQAGRLGEYADPEGDERKLREQITRAERGESLADFSRMKPETAEAARAFVALMSHDGLPDYCRDSMTEMLSQLQSATGAGLWQTPHYTLGDSADEVGDWSAATLAGVFHNPPRDLPALKPELDLAGMIAAVLTHPDTPGYVAEGLNQGLTDLFNYAGGETQGHFTTSPEYVAGLLAYCGKEGGEE